MRMPSPKTEILDVSATRPVRVCVVEDDSVVREKLIPSNRAVRPDSLFSAVIGLRKMRWKKYRGKNPMWCSWTSICRK